MTEMIAQRLTSAPAAGRFDKNQADGFALRSPSEETRRAYKRMVREFFATTGNLHPTTITPQHIWEWRDTLMRWR